MKKLFYNSFVPLVMLTVIALHLYNVRKNHLTTWKGGGFGMYAEYPWLYREVWLFGLPPDPLAGFRNEADYIRQYPTRENMQILANKLKERHHVQAFYMEVWEPRFNRDGTLTRVKLNQLNVE